MGRPVHRENGHLQDFLYQAVWLDGRDPGHGSRQLYPLSPEWQARRRYDLPTGWKGSTTKGVWLPYFSVENLNGVLETVGRSGGRVEVKAHDFPNRGEQAIIRDNQEALLGLMRTTDGDPDDFLADYGELIWAQLWVRDPDQSLPFYKAVLGFTEMEGDPEDENIYDHVWGTDGRYRASLDRIPDSMPNGVPSWFTFVRVESIKDTVAQVELLGGLPLHEARSRNQGWAAWR